MVGECADGAEVLGTAAEVDLTWCSWSRHADHDGTGGDPAAPRESASGAGADSHRWFGVGETAPCGGSGRGLIPHERLLGTEGMLGIERGLAH